MRPAFHPVSEFPALADLARHWVTIRDEAVALDAPVLDIDRVGKSHEQVNEEMKARGLFHGWMHGWTLDDRPNKDWLQYAIALNGKTSPGARGTLPKTVALIAATPGLRVAALSRMNPHSLISTHSHEYLREKGILQFHLGLDVPAGAESAWLGVDGQMVRQVEGQPIVFDGSLPHFAVNASNASRTILYVEFFHDMLRTPASAAAAQGA